MQKSFEVQNLKCGGCANTITKKLSKNYDNVTVDPESKTVSLELEEGQEEAVKNELKELGYPVVGEAMGFFESTGAKAKSFVSCAIGKIDK